MYFKFPNITQYFNFRMSPSDILYERGILTFGALSAELGIPVNQAKIYLERLKRKTTATPLYYVTGKDATLFFEICSLLTISPLVLNSFWLILDSYNF